MNLDANVMTEYFYDDKKKAIILHRYPAEECVFCSGKQQIIYFKKFHICKSCIQSLPALQVFIERIERERAKEIQEIKVSKRRKQALDRLHQAMKENPEASQKELAKLTGFSEAWVSKLLRNM
ncbi:regulator [Paenibacillus ehimensis]|uniref:regulator n=1 Tax=Paenibacillus ehimensis TaxID=79264 RepID=UPI002DBB86B5|nr:regulator [Paenibacillus ehimensis]MEC0210263.1 regulator [Paenibacillus ehimensis]